MHEGARFKKKKKGRRPAPHNHKVSYKMVLKVSTNLNYVYKKSNRSYHYSFKDVGQFTRLYKKCTQFPLNCMFESLPGTPYVQ